MDTYLIVGLGNPGLLYTNTRHNVGFKVLNALAKKHGLEFKKDKKLKSKISKGKILERQVFLLKPETYMNLSGEALRACVDYYKIELDKILVVVDDADIPFEEFRLKKDSGAAGHRGLKNIEEHLNTKAYARLKVGIGRDKNELRSYVLGRFSKEERAKLKEIEIKAISFIELWLEKGMNFAATQANIRR